MIVPTDIFELVHIQSVGGIFRKSFASTYFLF